MVRDLNDLGLAVAFCWTVSAACVPGKAARWNAVKKLHSKKNIFVTLLLSVVLIVQHLTPLVLQRIPAAAVVGAPTVVTAHLLATLPAKTTISIFSIGRELAAGKAQGPVAVEETEKPAIAVPYVSRFVLPGLLGADALSADDVTAPGGSQNAGSESTQPAAISPPWQVPAADDAASQEATDTTGGQNENSEISEELGKPSKNEDETVKVGNEDKNTEKSGGARGLNAVAPGSSVSDSEEDDILSFLQLALGAAAVLAISTWLLLEQRKALNRARYDRLTDLLGT